ncbi:hypothetical protein NFI96_011429, partial [Prochilodus magdalenae]
THTLEYILTGVTPGISFPEFTAVGQLDGEQGGCYDSDHETVILKADWIKNNNDTSHWNLLTQNAQGNQESFKIRLSALMRQLNQSDGIHTWQRIEGCELQDDGAKKGFMQYGYDGEDWLSLDLNTITWTAAHHKAVPLKLMWERGGYAHQKKNYLEIECIENLQKYVDYGREALERKVRPEVSLFQKDSSSPVVCHATGFFPKAVMIFWKKNGEDVHEDVELRETLPNQDGTFQRRSILTLSPEELDNGKHTCVIQHKGLEKEIVLLVSDRRVLSGGGTNGIIIGVVVAVLLLVVIGCVGFFVWKKKSGFKPVTQTPSEDSASDKS